MKRFAGCLLALAALAGGTLAEGRPAAPTQAPPVPLPLAPAIAFRPVPPLAARTWPEVGHVLPVPAVMTARAGVIYGLPRGALAPAQPMRLLGQGPEIAIGRKASRLDEGHFIRLAGLAFGPDGRLYLGDGAEGLIRAATPDGQLHRVWGSPREQPFNWLVAIGVDGQGAVYALDGNPQGRVILRRLPSGRVEVVARLPGGEPGFGTLAVARDGACFLTGGKDDTLWRVEAGKLRAVAPPHKASHPSFFLAVDAAGRVFLDGRDGGIDVWTSAGRRPVPLTGLPSPAPGWGRPSFTAVAADGEAMYAVEANGTIWKR
ncbi:MAG: SMP-30/Gluconolactonase/LRE-like region [Cyanobacteria bacterium RYN_339]|nr:SMP-30/Gluconolactonase/LRE-like region [Cyanobacteria bacterium RYN_339]